MKWLLLLAPAFLALSSIADVLVAPPPVESRMAQANIVFVGELSSQSSSGGGLDLMVIQGYKNAARGNVIAATSRATRVRLAPAVRYLLFLGNRSDSGLWLVLSAVPLPSDFPLSLSPHQGGSLESDIDVYLGSAKTRPLDMTLMVTLLNQFATISPFTVALLDDLATRNNNAVALWSQSILLMRNLGPATLFTAYLHRLEASPAQEIPFTGNAQFIFRRYATREDISDLQKLSHSDDTEVRHAAILAMKKVADKGTTRFWIDELDDRDVYNEYIAVSTLADLYGKTGEYGPGLGEFEGNRTRFIDLWKAWFKAGGK